MHPPLPDDLYDSFELATRRLARTQARPVHYDMSNLVTQHRDVIVTPNTLEPIAGDRLGKRYLGGALFEDGRLIQHSQRLTGPDDMVISRNPVALSPAELEESRQAKRINGHWYFGGHWMGQFGHFIVETLTGLWANDEHRSRVFYLNFIFGRAEREWQREFLELLPYPLKYRVAPAELCRVESMTVATRPVTINVAASSRAVDVWESIGRSAGVQRGSAERIFLSRSRLTQDPRASANDTKLDDLARDLGMHVVFPEELSVSEQVRLVRSSRLVVGVAGSALHLTAFASSKTRVIELGDPRSPARHVPMQLVIDSARNRETAFVPYYRSADSDGQRDLTRTREHLTRLLASPGRRWLGQWSV